MGGTSAPHLWQCFKATTEVGHWKALNNESKGHLLLFKKCKKEGKGRNFMLLTNAFKTGNRGIESSVVQFTEEEAAALCQLPMECLKKTCKRLFFFRIFDEL
jgi:hypothetical protein